MSFCRYFRRLARTVDLHPPCEKGTAVLERCVIYPRRSIFSSSMATTPLLAVFCTAVSSQLMQYTTHVYQEAAAGPPFRFRILSALLYLVRA